MAINDRDNMENCHIFGLGTVKLLASTVKFDTLCIVQSYKAALLSYFSCKTYLHAKEI